MSSVKFFEKHLRDYKQSPAKTLPEKPHTSNRIDETMINKLTSELANVLIEKRKYELENNMLKLENKNYHTRVKLLVSEITSFKLMHGNNIMAIEQQLNNIQSQIQPKSINTISETCLQSKYEGNPSQVHTKLHEEINTLNNIVKDLKQNECNLKLEISTFKEKYHTYKEKLKFSINIITNLNKHITDRTNNLKEIGCQTEKENCVVERPAFEEQIISELFFRERPYDDDEHLLFLTNKQLTEVDINNF